MPVSLVTLKQKSIRDLLLTLVHTTLINYKLKNKQKRTGHLAETGEEIIVSTKGRYHWAIIYWMPYDNNLSRYKDEIMNMLTKGNKSTNDIAIFVFADSREQKFVERIEIRGGTVVASIPLGFKDSSNVNHLRKCLLKLKHEVKAQRWALIFLGHGGRLDELSPDQNQADYPSRKYGWMNMLDIKKVLFEFNLVNNQKLDLLYLQNCCKGTIEAVYNFSPVSKMIISSQKKLGAPNYYYEAVFNKLSKKPACTVEGLSRLIINHERSDMYHSLCAVKTDHMEVFVVKMQELVSYLCSQSIRKWYDVRKYKYYGEWLTDIEHFFNTLSMGDPEAENLHNTMIQYFKDEITAYHLVNDIKSSTHLLSGLSMFCPRDRNEASKYDYLDFYKNVSMSLLLEKIM